MKRVERGMAQTAVLVGLLALGSVVAAERAGSAAAGPEAAGAWKAVLERGCRWEVAAGAPWQEVPFDPGPGSPPPQPAALQPVTLLLDQCSGRTWTLTFVRGAFEWRTVRREPDWAVVRERP